jgi:uncharacterized membrane protein
MRKTIKILHTLSGAGLIGGLAAYMILLVAVPVDDPAAYAGLRQSIAVISNYVLLPSLAVALISGLLSMMVHPPFLDRGWVWIKAGLGILMFKGVLTVIGAKADHAAAVSAEIAAGTADPNALQSLIGLEWIALWSVMAISVANVVLGVWRPRILRLSSGSSSRARTGPATAAAAPGQPSGEGETRPAAAE